jgi:hypothetical protein
MSQTAFGEQAGIGEFLASHGGPFYELQLRLGLLRQESLSVGRRAAIFVALSWGVPLLLSLAQGLQSDTFGARAYLHDLSAWSRLFAATGLFILAEGQVEAGLRGKLAQFTRAPIIAPGSLPAAAEAVAAALRLRSSRAAELVCGVLGFALSLSWLVHLLGVETESWRGVNGWPTLAGWWVIIFSGPLFNFLLLRGLWRYFVWARLLHRLSLLEFRLVASHPDGNGGIGFLAEYPNAYAIFVLGLSVVAAVAVTRHVFENAVSPTTFTLVTAIWLAIVLVVFSAPLLAFSPVLLRLKQDSLAVFSAQATRFLRQAEHTTLGRNVVADDPSEFTPERPVTDATASFLTTEKLSTFLLNRKAVVPVGAAALAPFAIVGAKFLPYKDVISILKKLLLL